MFAFTEHGKTVYTGKRLQAIAKNWPNLAARQLDFCQFSVIACKRLSAYTV